MVDWPSCQKRIDTADEAAAFGPGQLRQILLTIYLKQLHLGLSNIGKSSSIGWNRTAGSRT
jgi:hypothetical protein